MLCPLEHVVEWRLLLEHVHVFVLDMHDILCILKGALSGLL